MVDHQGLLKDLQRRVRMLEDDLREQVETHSEIGDPLKQEHTRAHKLNRTAATWTQWRDERVTQAAAGWVLGTVFVRFCEDNGLLGQPFLAAPTPDRMTLAEEAQAAHFRARPHDTDRDWLLAGFAAMAVAQAGRLLFDPEHNALYRIPISHDAAKSLIGFWRRRD
ncbi:MAG: BREX-2 system adenine-specific DNA-methyltransferase PglX, partial [Micromonosporaceae bacterium]